MQESKDYISKLSQHLFWDIDISNADMDICPAYIIQRVLEYGSLEDWRLIRTYYGLDKICLLYTSATCRNQRQCSSFTHGRNQTESRCFLTSIVPAGFKTFGNYRIHSRFLTFHCKTGRRNDMNHRCLLYTSGSCYC